MVLSGNFLGEHGPDATTGPGKDNGFAGQVKMFDAAVQPGGQRENSRAHTIAGTDHQAHIAVEHFVHGFLGHFVGRGSGFKVHKFANGAGSFVQVFAETRCATGQRAHNGVEFVLSEVAKVTVYFGVDGKECIAVLTVGKALFKYTQGNKQRHDDFG